MPPPAPLARAVHGLAHVSGLSRRRVRSQRVMRVVMLHDVGTAELPEDVFERQLAWLAQHLEPVSLAEIVNRLGDPGAICGREVALTFDDGLLNNLTVARRLLERHEVPATFFVCPGLVGSGRWIWNHEARARLSRLDRASIRRVAEDLAAPDRAGRGAGAFVRWMKTLSPEERAHAERRLRGATWDFLPNEEERKSYDLMSWENLAVLDETLIEIGAHTLHHPILTTLDDETLEREIVRSREQLEKRLRRPVEHFCYPNGDEDDRARAVVRSAFRAAVTVEPGFVRPGDDVHALARIGVLGSAAAFTWRLHRP